MSGGERAVEWPQKARLALSIVFNVEAWSDHSVGHLWISPLPKDAKVSQDFLTRTDREYGLKVGIWRMMEMLDSCGVRATAVVNGLVVERYPEVVKALYSLGYEIGGHGYDQSRPITIHATEAEEEQDLRQTTDLIASVTGRRPEGWQSGGLRSTPNTLGILSRLGYLWHGESLDDDLPYLVAVDGRVLVEIPYNIIWNDMPHYLRGLRTPEEVLGLMKYEFDTLYMEAERRPALMTYGVHPHVTGRPGAARAFKDFIRYASGHEGVWIPRRGEIARWWLERYGKTSG